jgi:ppGpp synthetase/RelA/SpoT-type nucleotidyltranferase
MEKQLQLPSFEVEKFQRPQKPTQKRLASPFTRGEVNKAGKFFRDGLSARSEVLWAAEVLGKWRAMHNYPINTFQATMRKRLQSIDRYALVAQRLKRIPSIIDKLRRFPDMELARMQDIGGLRAVVGTMRQLEALHWNYKEVLLQHELVSERDYISKPKASGYRSIHLVYRYKNPAVSNYDGLLIELQFRTRQQHAWATAVETMGTFLDYALKSSEGPDEWLKFFALTGSGFAHLEKQPLVPGFENLTTDETLKMIVQKARQLKVHEKLSGFGAAINAIHSEKSKGTYYLLVLDPVAKTLRFQAYSKDRFNIATSDYLKAEEQIIEGSQTQAVLVATASVEALRRAYPNFFLDTHEFLNVLKEIESIVEKAESKKLQFKI